MSSRRIPLTRTSPLEQRRRQQDNLQPEVDAGRGWRGTSHESESYASHNDGGFSINPPRREGQAMSGASHGSQGASAYGGRGGGYGEQTPSHFASTISSASMMSDANSGGYPAYPSLYDHADIDKLMDDYAGRTRPGPSPAYPQRYIESVEAALRVDAGVLGGPFPYQAEPQMLMDGPAMSRGGRHGGSGRRLLSRLPSHAGNYERFDGNIQGQRSVPQGNSFVKTRSRPSDMHSHSQRRSQPSESIEDIMERFDLGDGRGSRYDSHSRH